MIDLKDYIIEELLTESKDPEVKAFIRDYVTTDKKVRGQNKKIKKWPDGKQGIHPIEGKIALLLNEMYKANEKIELPENISIDSIKESVEEICICPCQVVGNELKELDAFIDKYLPNLKEIHIFPNARLLDDKADPKYDVETADLADIEKFINEHKKYQISIMIVLSKDSKNEDAVIETIEAMKKKYKNAKISWSAW